MKTEVKTVSKTEAPVADTRHLVTVIKNGLKADVTNTSLDGWLKKDWKRLDEPKAGE